MTPPSSYDSLDLRRTPLPPSTIQASSALSPQNQYARLETFRHVPPEHIQPQMNHQLAQDAISIQSSITNPIINHSSHQNNKMQQQLHQLHQPNSFLQQQYHNMTQQMSQSQRQINQMLQSLNTLQQQNNALIQHLQHKDINLNPTVIKLAPMQLVQSDSIHPPQMEPAPLTDDNTPISNSTTGHNDSSAQTTDPMISKLITMMDKQNKYYETKVE